MSNLPLINTAGETGAEMATDDALNERLLAALGSGAPQRAERQAQNEARLQQITGQVNAQDDLRSGRLQDIGDMQSEAAAGRQFLPFASQLRDVNTQDALAKAQAQYLLPAQMKAAGDRDAAAITAQGRVNAADAANAGVGRKGLVNALIALMEKSGKVPTADEAAQLSTLFGGIK